jgi:hypothetical protein
LKNFQNQKIPPKYPEIREIQPIMYFLIQNFHEIFCSSENYSSFCRSRKQKFFVVCKCETKRYDRVSRKNKFVLSCVRVQVHFKENVSFNLKNRRQISGFFSPVILLRNTGVLQTKESTKNLLFRTGLKTDWKPYTVVFRLEIFSRVLCSQNNSITRATLMTTVFFSRIA